MNSFKTAWLERLEADGLDPVIFTELIVQYIDHTFPELKAESLSPLRLKARVQSGKNEGYTIESSLENAWIICANEAGNRFNVLNHFFAGLADMNSRLGESGYPEDPTNQNVVPLVRSRDILKTIQSRGFHPFWKEHSEDIVVIFGVDQPNGMAMLSQEQQSKLGLTKQDLFDTALANLVRITDGKRAARPSENGFLQVVCGGDYESSLILIDKVMKHIAGLVAGRLIISIPSRDYVFATGEDSADGLSAVNAITKTVFEAGHHIISDKLYSFENGKLQVHS